MWFCNVIFILYTSIVNGECTIHVVHQKKFEFMLCIMMTILWQQIIFYYILYDFEWINIFTSVACAVGPCVTASTDYFFQNLVFWNLFDFQWQKSLIN